MNSIVLRSGETFAGYVIKRVLGQGGMGTVYLAKHPRLPRFTALKLLERDLYTDVEIRARFEREADLVAQLDHPNIVTVYDRGDEDDQLWISMQFVSGSDAASVDLHVMAPWRAVQIVAETGAALDFAHANGVLHRDVKPANILLAKAPIGQPERVLLTDFGIAAMRDAETTLGSAGTITATLAYASPEQLSGATLDHRSDQYSLACTLFWLLTGTAPFNGSSPAAVINGHLYGQVPPLRPLRPGIPPALEAVLARAMAKRAEDRFASCTEFAAAARRALAPPPGPGPRPPSRPAHPQQGYPGPGRSWNAHPVQPQPTRYPGPGPQNGPATAYPPAPQPPRPAPPGPGRPPVRPVPPPSSPRGGVVPPGPSVPAGPPTAHRPPGEAGPPPSGPAPTAHYPGHVPPTSAQPQNPYASGAAHGVVPPRPPGPDPRHGSGTSHQVRPSPRPEPRHGPPAGPRSGTSHEVRSPDPYRGGGSHGAPGPRSGPDAGQSPPPARGGAEQRCGAGDPDDASAAARPSVGRGGEPAPTAPPRTGRAGGRAIEIALPDARSRRVPPRGGTAVTGPPPDSSAPR